ncbi:uncharacterized protein LOC141607114 [Silene latifolia]|uniref:uncharacterized protein LOC141607114 n=1 Tax=Silene latifolia TaxID=37657 RepID=UPI003D77D993
MPFERERVLSIRLSPNEGDDTWYWGLEKDGEYSVKSAYAMLEGAREVDGGASVWERERWLWNRLWKIPLWPRVKLFFWRGGRKAGRVREGGNDGWCPAPEGKVKLNVDAGVKEGEGAGTGVVCRDSYGAVLWGLSIAREVEWEPVFAEAVAVLDGLQEAVSRGVREVVVENDCLQVIDALKEKRTGRSIFAQVLEDILVIFNVFQSVSWSYSNRVNNCVAHALAHAIPKISSRVVWSNVLPPSAKSAALFDLSLIK